MMSGSLLGLCCLLALGLDRPDMEIWAMEMTKSFMEKVKKMMMKEERRNLAKAVLITDHQEARGWPYIHC